MTKNWKKILQKNLNFFYQKLQFTHPKVSINDVQATGEAFSPQKRTSSTSKREICYFFPIFIGHFCPPGFGSGLRIRIQPLWPHWIRIRIQNTGYFVRWWDHTVGIHKDKLLGLWKLIMACWFYFDNHKKLDFWNVSNSNLFLSARAKKTVAFLPVSASDVNFVEVIVYRWREIWLNGTK